jgi:hypothetical protein
MSRGIGQLQVEILKSVENNGSWIWSKELVCDVWRGEGVITYSFYSSVRQAANRLVKRKALCSGLPEEDAGYRREHERMAYWLPTQPAPKLRKTFDKRLVEAVVLKVLQRATEPLTLAYLNCDATKLLARDRYEQDRTRVPLSRAVRSLLAKGKIKRCGETQSRYIATPTE